MLRGPKFRIIFGSPKHTTRNPFGASRRAGTIALWVAVLAWARGCAPAVPGSPQHGSLRSGRGSAKPQSAFLNPRRRFGGAAGGATGLRAVHRPRPGRAAGSGALGGGSDPGQRRHLGRRPDDFVSACGAACKWSDGRPVTSADVLFTLRGNPRSAQSRALARRLRSHRPRVRDRDRASSSFTCAGRGRPAATTYFSYGISPQFVLPAHVLQAQTPLERAAFNAEPSVGDGPYRFRVVETRRRAALCRQSALLARQARGRNARDSNHSRPFDQSALAAIGRVGLESARAGATCGRARRSAFAFRYRADRRRGRTGTEYRSTRRSTIPPCGARLRCRSIAAKSRKKSRWASIP